ncbi:phage head closure protein [Rhizobium sp. TH2]|uniref:phage head closure protein n=1 Tax=Rhizobium sp. TH2 TaxID=2775403 RepID=UPI0021573298|nr:phage head closure protein [Rhizobium sp. TH2]UVC10348.1 phage head closure protein [Rhizobium sp. TH2]
MNLTFLDAGQLTARLDLESPVETPDGQGGVTVSHAVESTLWARIEPVSAVREELGHIDRQAVTHRIWVRRTEGVSAGKRFRKGGRIFEIHTVHDPDERGRYLVAQVTEV